jgi:predicted nucleic acid-binding protein
LREQPDYTPGQARAPVKIVAVIAANRRDLSLVDAVSFDVMRRRGISRAFGFDRQFAEAGFARAGSG